MGKGEGERSIELEEGSTGTHRLAALKVGSRVLSITAGNISGTRSSLGSITSFGLADPGPSRRGASTAVPTSQAVDINRHAASKLLKHWLHKGMHARAEVKT